MIVSLKLIFSSDKDTLLGYCQNMDAIIQKSLKPLLSSNKYQDMITILRQVNQTDIFSQIMQNDNDDYYRPSAETLACQVI